MKGDSLYLIKIGQYHQIGITDDLERRLKGLEPDHVHVTLIAKDDEMDVKDIQAKLFKRFKEQRIGATETFRFTDEEVLECSWILKTYTKHAGTPLEDFIVMPNGETIRDTRQTIKMYTRFMELVRKEAEIASEGNNALAGAELEVIKDFLATHFYAFKASWSLD